MNIHMKRGEGLLVDLFVSTFNAKVCKWVGSYTF